MGHTDTELGMMYILLEVTEQVEKMIETSDGVVDFM